MKEEEKLCDLNDSFDEKPSIYDEGLVENWNKDRRLYTVPKNYIGKPEDFSEDDPILWLERFIEKSKIEKDKDKKMKINF